MAMNIQPPHQFDSGDDLTPLSTNTPTVMETKDCEGDTTNTSTVMEMKKKRAYRRKKYLPHEIITEHILTRLPVPTLLTSVLVSKLWYNSIRNDNKRLTYSHFLQAQKQPDLVFSLLNVKAFPIDEETVNYNSHFLKFTTGNEYRDLENVLEFQRLRGGLSVHDILEMVGYCNGLPCMALVSKYLTAYMIVDPNRKDFMYINYPAIVGKGVSTFRIICHGFGFDPSADKYKVVSILRTPLKEINFLVFTLGTKSWRNVTAKTTPIPSHGGRPVLKIRAPMSTDESAIFCTDSSSSSGCLVWKVIATMGGAGYGDIQHDNSNEIEMEMLLSFNLHDEKFHFIQLPSKITTDEQQNHLLVDNPHLLRFKSSPCIARIEKISGSGSNYPHRCRDDHQGGNSCCCCCKVHVYMLKDKIKQTWVKEETFEVRLNSTPKWLENVGYLAPDPCCFCIGSTSTPSTRICSYSDQMLLYWFNGKYLQIYNLRTEKLQLILPVNPREKEPRHIPISGTDYDIYFSDMVYQLHCHEENFLSMETFIPEGVEGVVSNEFSGTFFKRGRRCSAYVFIHRGSKVYYPIYK